MNSWNIKSTAHMYIFFKILLILSQKYSTPFYKLNFSCYCIQNLGRDSESCSAHGRSVFLSRILRTDHFIAKQPSPSLRRFNGMMLHLRFILYFNSQWFVDLGINVKVHFRTVWGLAKFRGIEDWCQHIFQYAWSGSLQLLSHTDHYPSFSLFSQRNKKKLLANKNVNSSLLFLTSGQDP